MIELRTLLAIFILSALLGAGCIQHEESTSIVSDKKIEDFPDHESWESAISITKEGRKVAKIWAGYLAMYNKKNELHFKDSIHVDLYNREGEHSSTLTAQKCVVDNRTKDMVASGNVVVVSDSGIVLETEKLRWNQEKQKIISDIPVKFTTHSDTLLGDSFISDSDLKRYEIRNARGYSRRLLPIKK